MIHISDPTQTVEEVVANAHEELLQTGSLDIEKWVAAYPQYENELRKVLPVMQVLDEERLWMETENRANEFARNLFANRARRDA